MKGARLIMMRVQNVLVGGCKMTFDVSYFGQGLGLVILGYAVGFVLSIIFSVISRLSDI